MEVELARGLDTGRHLGKLEGDRAALIEELRHEREVAARAAEAAAEGVEVVVAPVEHNAETLFKR